MAYTVSPADEQLRLGGTESSGWDDVNESMIYDVFNLFNEYNLFHFIMMFTLTYNA